MTVNPVYKDRSRMVKLIDKFNVVRYTLTLLEFDGTEFVVKVKEYGEQWFPKEIIRETYSDLETAEKSFHKLMDDYSAIIILDDKSAVQAEDIFDHAVGYHLCSPKCCSSCRYSMRDRKRRSIFGERFICLNENNIRTFNRILNENNMKNYEAKTFMVVHPEVSPVGICKNYKKTDSCCDKRFELHQMEFDKDCDWMKFKERNQHRPDVVDVDFIMDDVDVEVR